MVRRGAIVASLSIALGACGGGADKTGSVDEAAPVVLTFASTVQGMPVQIEAYFKEVERRADGTLRLDYVDGWHDGEPDQEVELIEDVRAGKVDMAWVGARAFDSVGVTSFQALIAPFLVDSYDLQDAVFDDGIPARMLAGLDELGLTGIGVLPGPLRQMLGIDHAFVALADFDGAVVGTSGGDLAERTLHALGATPQMVPAQTSLDGLDALDYHLSAIYGNLFYETAEYVTANLDLWPRPLLIVIDSERFAELTVEQQAILGDAAAAAIGPASAVTREDEADYSGTGLCATGIKVVEVGVAERAALVDAVSPVYAEIEADAETRAFLDEIRAIKQATDAPPESLECPRAATDAEVSAATPIDGVWRFTTTAEDLRAAGDPNPIPENYGDWVNVFANGRFVTAQQSAEACGWGYGTFAVEGDRVAMTMIGGGGIAPNNALNKPGEHFVYRWSRYRDTLTLTPVGQAPDIPALEPWRLTDEAPSAGVFPSRCRPSAEALEGLIGG
jgi:TRAP-type C4-dicarboxylate transport system substrate-binding protein